MNAAYGGLAVGIAVDVTFHASWWHKYAGISFAKEFFLDPGYRIDCDMKMRKLLYEKFGKYGMGDRNPAPRALMGSDLLASGYLYSQIMGCPVHFYDNTPPEVICAQLTDEQIEALARFDLSANEVWKETIKQFAYLEDRYGYVESHINLQGVQNIALDLRGSSLYIDYYENPELASALIEACTRVSTDIGKYIRSKSRVMSHGVTAITAKVMPEVYVTSNCTVEMISEENYEEFLLEPDRRLSSVFRPFGVHHCGQTMEHVANAYAKIENLDFAEAGAGSDIAKVREALPKVFLNLRYSPVKLKTASEAELQKEIEAMAKAAGHSFSISCVGIDAETDDRQIERFIDSVNKLK